MASIPASVCKVAILAALAMLLVLLAASTELEGGGLSFPSVHIDVDGGEEILSKEGYLRCRVSLDNQEPGFEGLDAGVKGRGNSSWNEVKKPYTLKLDKAASFLGMPADKTWVLTANHRDQTLSRTYYAFSAAEAVGCPFTPSCAFVNLYVNGDYRGVYLLSEKIEMGPGRVEIDDSVGNVDFGFIVEMDGWAIYEGDEDVDYFKIGRKSYSVKDPKCIPEQLALVKEAMVGAPSAIESGDWAAVEERIDVDSFARTYIVEELFSESDVNFSSFYFFRDAGGRISSGPIWDFDHSAGDIGTSDRMFSSRMFVDKKSIWYSGLLGHEEFQEKVAEVLSERSGDIREALAGCSEHVLSHSGDFHRNFARWRYIGTNVFSAPLEFMMFGSWERHLEFLDGWLSAKLDLMLEAYRLR